LHALDSSSSFPSVVHEVYRSGRTAVWSKGGSVVKTFKGDAAFRQALLAHFHDHPQRPRVVIADQSEPNVPNNGDKEEDFGPRQLCVCLLEGSTLRVHREDGADFLVAVPFPVAKIWPMK